MIDLAINELSYLSSQASNKEEAKLWYDTFFRVCTKIAKDYKVNVVLKYSEKSSIQSTALHPTYSFGQWLHDKTSDERSLILSMLTQMPLVNYPFYKVYGMEGHGIGYSYENNCLLLSLKSHSRWQINKLSVSKEYLNEDASKIKVETREIHNCFQEACIQTHEKFIKTGLSDKEANALKEITSGEVLWRERKRFFPDLLFCDSIENQIKHLAGNEIKNLREYLKEFQNYFSTWKEGDFDRKPLPGRPRLESETRIKKFHNRLVIACPDGENRLFSLHGNWGDKDSRMHFFPNTTSRKCIIGYIGKKIV